MAYHEHAYPSFSSYASLTLSVCLWLRQGLAVAWSRGEGIGLDVAWGQSVSVFMVVGLDLHGLDVAIGLDFPGVGLNSRGVDVGSHGVDYGC